jgi:membrane protein DedA with SNARE-associated domain
MSAVSIAAAEISRYGYPALLSACIVEGPIATVIGGLLASLGLLDVRFVFAVSVLGDLVGDMLYYWAGRNAFGWRWLQRRISKRRQAVDALRTQFLRSPAKAILLGKWLHAPGFAVLLAAGAFRMPVLPFLAYNALATLPKSALLVIVGRVFGDAYVRLDRMMFMTSVVVLAVLVIGGAWYVRRTNTRRDAHRDLHR